MGIQPTNGRHVLGTSPGSTLSSRQSNLRRETSAGKCDCSVLLTYAELIRLNCAVEVWEHTPSTEDEKDVSGDPCPCIPLEPNRFVLTVLQHNSFFMLNASCFRPSLRRLLGHLSNPVGVMLGCCTAQRAVQWSLLTNSLHSLKLPLLKTTGPKGATGVHFCQLLMK